MQNETDKLLVEVAAYRREVPKEVQQEMQKRLETALDSAEVAPIALPNTVMFDGAFSLMLSNVL